MTSNKYKNHCLYCFSGFARSREKSSGGKFLKSRVAWTVNADSPAAGRSDHQQKGWVGSWAWNSDGRVQRGLKGTQKTGCLTRPPPKAQRNAILLGGNLPQCKPLGFPPDQDKSNMSSQSLITTETQNERATGDCQLHGSFWSKLSRMFGNLKYNQGRDKLGVWD